MIHRSINTLPIDCFMLIQESISINEPDFSYLIARENYYYKPDQTYSTDELLTAWRDVLFSFGEQQLNNKVIRLSYDIQVLINRMLLTNNADLKHLIEQKQKQLDDETQGEKFSMDNFYDTQTQISIHLGISFTPFSITTRQYFNFVKALNEKAQKARANGR